MDLNMPNCLQTIKKFLDLESFKKCLKSTNNRGEIFFHRVIKQELLEDITDFILKIFDLNFLRELLIQKNLDQEPPFFYFIQHFHCIKIYQKYFTSEEIKEILKGLNSKNENFLHKITDPKIMEKSLKFIYK
jgi:hypothetical protein